MVHEQHIHLSPLFFHSCTVHTASQPYAAQKAQKLGVNVFDLFVCRGEDTTLLQKDREGVMTEAESLNRASVLPACALQRRAVRKPRGSFSVTSLSEPTMAQMAPGKRSCCDLHNLWFVDL